MNTEIGVPTMVFGHASQSGTTGQVNTFAVREGRALDLSVSQVILVAPSERGEWSNVASFSFDSFRRAVESSDKRLDVAKQVIRSLRRKEKYMDLYLEYSQGALTSDAFNEASSSLAASPREVNAEEVVLECGIVAELTGETDLDSNELSVLLDLDTFELENILRACEQKPRSITGPESD
jgi:hypothetical protein